MDGQFELTAEMIAGLSGVVISLLFSYFPALSAKFAALSSEAKSGIMLGLMALVTASITALNYYGIIDAGLSFEGRWLPHVVWVFITAVIANQAAHRISPETHAVEDAKEGRA